MSSRRIRDILEKASELDLNADFEGELDLVTVSSGLNKSRGREDIYDDEGW